MHVKGELLIGGESYPGEGKAFFAIKQVTGERLAEAFHSALPDDVETALAGSWEAFDSFRETPLRERAEFLDRIAENIQIGRASCRERVL